MRGSVLEKKEVAEYDQNQQNDLDRYALTFITRSSNVFKHLQLVVVEVY